MVHTAVIYSVVGPERGVPWKQSGDLYSKEDQILEGDQQMTKGDALNKENISERDGARENNHEAERQPREAAGLLSASRWNLASHSGLCVHICSLAARLSTGCGMIHLDATG